LNPKEFYTLKGFKERSEHTEWKDPGQVVRVNQRIMVTVFDVELERNRISLSMKENVARPERYGKKQEKPQKTK